MKSSALFLFVPLLNGAVIEGTAYNKLTQAGVPGVTVTLAASTARDKPLYTATSDSTGAFRFDDVNPGDYVAEFKAPHGFEAPERWDPWCQPFHVASAGDPGKLRVPITPMGSIRGRVVDPDGHPVPRVRVEIFRVHYHGGALLTTDAEGRFFQDGLNSGAYQLRARPVLPGTHLGLREKAGVSALPPTPPEGERWIWAPTYFPNAIEIGGAMTIQVHDGSELTGYEIKLRAAPVYRLRGVVLDEESAPAAGVDVFLLTETGWGTAEAKAVSAGDGSFEFPNARAGAWRITAEVTRGKIKSSGFLEFAMPKHDVDDAKVRIAAPFALKGTVEGAPPRSSISVSLMPANHGEEANAMEQSDGALLFEDVYPGTYRVAQWSRLPGHYLKSFVLGTQDVTGRDVVLTRDSPGLRVIYAPNAAQVRGTVENGAGVKVVAIEADGEHTIPGVSLRATVCDRDGRFAIEGLRPTSYYVFAFAIGNVESDGVQDAVFARGLGRQAKTVLLSEGETATVELKITPWPE